MFASKKMRAVLPIFYEPITVRTRASFGEILYVIPEQAKPMTIEQFEKLRKDHSWVHISIEHVTPEQKFRIKTEVIFVNISSLSLIELIRMGTDYKINLGEEFIRANLKRQLVFIPTRRPYLVKVLTKSDFTRLPLSEVISIMNMNSLTYMALLENLDSYVRKRYWFNKTSDDELVSTNFNNCFITDKKMNSCDYVNFDLKVPPQFSKKRILLEGDDTIEAVENFIQEFKRRKNAFGDQEISPETGEYMVVTDQRVYDNFIP